MTNLRSDGTKKIRRILCATDTSRASQPAVTKAAALAVYLDVELVIMYVSTAEDDGSDLSSIFAMSREIKRLADEMLKHDQAALDVLVEGARAAGARVRRHLVIGHAADEIVKAAVELEADLVISGTHGRTGVDKFLLGSVAERLIRISTVPVMVARNPVHVPANGYKKILVPTDFSDHAKAAFNLAVALGSPDCEIELLHCWRLPPGAGAGPSSVVESIIRSIDHEIRDRGKGTLSELVKGGATVTFHAVRKPPSSGISERIGEGDFDLVVMGSHGRSGLRRFVLGSVAETTIHYAPCSVVTVPDVSKDD